MKATDLVPKVRLVKCPKCFNVLPELADVPVYQCGGCGTILQAKNRRGVARATSSSQETQKTDPAQTSEPRPVSEYRESGSSSHDTVVCSSGDCSSDQENGKGQNGSMDPVSEQLDAVRLSNGEENDDMHQQESSLSNIDQSVVSSGVGSSAELGQIVNEESTEANYAAETNDENAALAGIASQANLLNKRGSIVRSSDTENQPLDTAQRQENETLSSDVHVSSFPEEQRDQPQKHSFHDRDHMVSTDTLEGADFPTNGNSGAYAVSLSSYDGGDEPLPSRHVPPAKSAYDNARLPVPDEWHRRARYPMDRSSEMQKQRRNSSSLLSHEKQDGSKYSKWDRDQLLDPDGDIRPIKNWSRYGGDEYRSQMPFYQRGLSSLRAYESGSPSNQSYNEFHGSSSHSVEMPEYIGYHQMQLLRKLNWKEAHNPAYYNHEGPGRIYHDISYGGNTGAFGRIPYSAETTDRWYQRGNSYSCSGQLPSHVLQHLHPGHECHNFYGSCSESPLKHMDSEYYPKWSREIVSDTEDQRHNRYEVKKYLRERHHAGKRHLRPIVGGAPFIICHYCLETLQLPVDFLIFRKRIHLLSCGACSKVLQFSLQDRTHLVPAHVCLNGNVDATDESYNSSSAAGERSRLHSKQSQNNHNTFGETSESGGQSSKAPKPKKTVSSEGEGLPPAKGSPLHRLMGYSTISQVFKATERPCSRPGSDQSPENQMSK